jgi:hypothetical protein
LIERILTLVAVRTEIVSSPVFNPIENRPGFGGPPKLVIGSLTARAVHLRLGIGHFQRAQTLAKRLIARLFEQLAKTLFEIRDFALRVLCDDFDHGLFTKSGYRSDQFCAKLHFSLQV